MSAPARHVCPICGREAPPPGSSAAPGNRSFPFCSPACKLVDLGRWLDGSYRLGGEDVSATEEGDGGRSAADVGSSIPWSSWSGLRRPGGDA